VIELNETNDYLTILEAAQILRVHRRTIERMIANERLRNVIKIGNRLRIPRSAITQYQQDQRIN